MRPEAWMAACAGLVGVALAVAAATTGQLLVFGLLLIAVLPWMALLLRSSWPHHKYVSAAVLSVTFIAIAIVVRNNQEHPRIPPSITLVSSLTRAAAQLKFLPLPGPVPHCISFTGTGKIPAGAELVILDRTTDPAGYYTDGSDFSYDGPAEASGSGWTAPDRKIGSGDASDYGSHTAIVGLLVTDSVGNYLDDSTSNSDTGQVPPSVIGLGVQADRIVVVRNHQNGPCP